MAASQVDGVDLDLPPARRRRDVLSHAALPRVRRVRDVVLVVLPLEVQGRSVHRDPGLAVALLPALASSSSTSSSGIREPERPDRQARRLARVPDDRAGLDPRDPGRRIRRPGRLGAVPQRRRRGAWARREDRARSPAQHQAARRSARPTRSTADARRRTHRCALHRAQALVLREGAGVRRLFEDYRPGRACLLPEDEDLPDHAHGRAPARRVREEPLARGRRSTRRSSRRRPSRTPTCARRRRCK